QHPALDHTSRATARSPSAMDLPNNTTPPTEPNLHLTEWTLLEEVARWEHADDPERKALGQEWRHILDRQLKWRMSHEVVLDLFEPRRGFGFMKGEGGERRVRGLLPPAMRAFPFKIEVGLQEPRRLSAPSPCRTARSSSTIRPRGNRRRSRSRSC